MKSITMRDLRGRATEIWKKLSRDKELVLTSNGKPIAILSAVSEDTLENSLVTLRRARAIAAVESTQSRSVVKGTDALTLEEINAEIKAARKARRR
jgi:antitoxin (DNA-binding transcriptional repressor) of toxin-antitoxin stability system